MFSGFSMRSFVLVCALFVAAGCDDGGGSGGAGGGSGGSGATGGGGSGAQGGGGSGAQGGGGSGGSTDTGTGTGTGTGTSTDEFAACQGKFEGQDPACQTCVQDNCKDVLIACCEADGCAEVVSCAVATGCDGLNCYMDGVCKDEIDAAGGPVGAGVAAAQEFGACAQGMCTEPCMQ